MLSLEVTLQFPAIGAEAEHHIEGPFALLYRLYAGFPVVGETIQECTRIFV